MPTLAFIFGREPHLSVAEIAAVLGDRAEWARAPGGAGSGFAGELSREALVVSTQDVGEGFMPSRDRTGGNESRPYIFAQSLTVRLGGTVKIGEVWRTIKLKNGEHENGEQTRRNPDGFDEAIGRYILDQTIVDRKVHFGYSVYDLGAGPARTAAMRTSLTRGAAAQKLWLTGHGRKVRWVTSREQTLSSVIVQKNDLLPERNGVEVLVLVAADHIILARTLAVQPFEGWGARDFGRPKRDARSGMLPPKLARIMLNIGISNLSSQGGSPPKDGHGASGGKLQIANTTVLDPFCGSGTVLTEAMELGITRIIGTDVSAEAIRDATANIAWLGERLATQHEVTITACDVRQLSRCVRERVDAIVTEPYLGPARANERLPRIEGTIAELRALYVDAFREFAKVLKPGGRAVFIVPEFRTGARPHVVDITRDVEQLGFRRISPFPSALAPHPMLRGDGDLPYARPDQRVGRRILVFEKT